MRPTCNYFNLGKFPVFNRKCSAKIEISFSPVYIAVSCKSNTVLGERFIIIALDYVFHSPYDIWHRHCTGGFLATAIVGRGGDVGGAYSYGGHFARLGINCGYVGVVAAPGYGLVGSVIGGDNAYAECLISVLTWFYKDSAMVIRGTGAASTPTDNCYIEKTKLLYVDSGVSTISVGTGQVLETVILLDGITEASIYGDNLRKVEIPNSVTSLWVESESIKTLNLPSKLEYLTVRSCSGLTELDLPNGLLSFSAEVCTGLKKVNLPDSIIRIKVYGCATGSSRAAVDMRSLPRDS